MVKTLKAGYGKDSKKVTIESTDKKLYGTLIWIDQNTKEYYRVERSRHLGRTIEAAAKYNITKKEFDEI